MDGNISIVGTISNTQLTDNINNLNTNINNITDNINGENAIIGINSLTSRSSINCAIITIGSTTDY